MSFKKLSTELVDADVVLAYPPCRWQRNHEQRTLKKHLSVHNERHLEFAVAVYPDGRKVVVDGNTRAAIYREFPSRKPATLHVAFYAVQSDEDTLDLYNTFDGKGPVKDNGDAAFGAMRSVDLVLRSAILRGPEVYNILRYACGHWKRGDLKVIPAVAYWRETLLDLDQMNLPKVIADPHSTNNRRVTASIAACFLLLLRKYRDEAKPFIRLFQKGQGTVVEGAMDGVAYALAATGKLSADQNKQFASISEMLYGYDMWRDGKSRPRINRNPTYTASHEFIKSLGSYVEAIGCVSSCDNSTVAESVEDTSQIPLFEPTAQCPRCNSFNTKTLYTTPEKGLRSHQCESCDEKFKTKSAK